MSIIGMSINWVKVCVACLCCVACVGFAGAACVGLAASQYPPPSSEAISDSSPSDSTGAENDTRAASSPSDSIAGQGNSPAPALNGNGNSWESSVRLPDIVARLQKILPDSWEVSGIQHKQTPRKWTGTAEGILIRLENPSIVAYHPNGFEYHPFFKIWLCPTLWRGNMEDVRFLEENDWSVLLGQNHKMKVFYLTLGANDWRDGPELLRKALDLTSLPITRSLRQKIEPSMMMKVFPKLAVSANGRAGLLERVVGLEMEGPLAYVEYATATAGNGSSTNAATTANGGSTTNGSNAVNHTAVPNSGRTNAQVTLSRCREPGVAWLMERENLSLANQILLAYPEVQTVYLRRVCDEFASDRIINRSDEASREPVILSNSSH